MKNSIIIAIIMFSNIIIAQEQPKNTNKINKLNIEFGFGINGYDMGKLNEFYIDSFARLPSVDLLEDHIKKGQHFRLALSYQPTGLFDVGVYGAYQYGNSTSQPLFTEVNDIGMIIREHKGTFELRTEAISVGIRTTWYLSHLLKFQEKENFLNRFHFGVEANGGVGFAKSLTYLVYKTFPPGLSSDYHFFKSNDFQGQLGMKAEYDFAKSPLFTTLGIRFGYQYFRTKTLKDNAENDWIVQGENPINLDFSGFYFGTYFKIGK